MKRGVLHTVFGAWRVGALEGPPEPGRPARDPRNHGTKTACAAALFLLATMAASAVEPNERLKDPALEARARVLSTGLRCLVCQNKTIDESGASLAHDIRMLLRERLSAGDTDEQAIKAIVKRYGEFVLLNPPVRPATYVLWFGPPALLVIGLASGFFWVRQRPATLATAAPLTPEESRRLTTILRETDR